ncbi:MAG: DUF4148 domain-containing protein [Bacteroidia bacterium]|nr:DUF4148 domain-containing protein [Polaromonas sp.]MCZ8284502.1 DUF4148 domain-containing protein [Bacteroidia bacterium]
MKSNLVSASVLAISAVAIFGSASSFAEGRDPYPLDQVNSSVSTKTRAEVKAELLQAQREGYNVNLGNNYGDVHTAPVSNKTRAEVKAEIGKVASASAIERDYPVVQ